MTKDSTIKLIGGASLAAISVVIGISLTSEAQQTPDQLKQQFRADTLAAIDAYHDGMVNALTVEEPTAAPPAELPRRIWIDAKLGDAVMAEAAANGDVKAGRVSSRFWTNEANELDQVKWREYLTTTNLRNEHILFGDWEKDAAAALRAGDPQFRRDFTLVALMAQKYQPKLLWTFYNLGREQDETLQPVQSVLDESTFLVSSIYLREGNNAGSIDEAKSHAHDKISAVMRRANGRPVLVEQQAWIKGGERMSETMLYETLKTAIELGAAGLILFDNTRNAFNNGNLELIPGIRTLDDVDAHEHWVYSVFHAAMDGSNVPADITPIPPVVPDLMTTIDLHGGTVQQLEIQPNTRYRNGTVENVKWTGAFTGRVELIDLTIGGRGLEVACDSLLIERCRIVSNYYAVINRGDGVVKDIICKDSYFEQTNGSQATFRLHGNGQNTLEATGCTFVNNFGHKALRVYTYASVKFDRCNFSNGSAQRLNASAIDIGIHANDPHDTSGSMGCDYVSLSDCTIDHNGGDVPMRIGFNKQVRIHGLIVASPFARPWNDNLMQTNGHGIVAGVKINGRDWPSVQW